MEQFHGTNKQNAIDLTRGLLSVDFGGGELGKGFYTGDLPHEAHNWAYHKYNNDKSVVTFIIADNDFINLTPLILDYHQTCRKRRVIRDNCETRDFEFGENAIWAPVVGRQIANFNQIKYESKTAENYLNSDKVIKIAK